MYGKTNLSQKELEIAIKRLIENGFNELKKCPFDIISCTRYTSKLVCLNALGYISDEEYDDLRD